MRRQLLAAVLAAIGGAAAGLPDTDRLLRVVTVAKAELARNCATSSTSAELGRWLGVSASAVQQSLDRQREAGTIITRPRLAANGRVVGLFVGVPEQIAARTSRDIQHPLFLERAALATLLRLIEYLFAPGWRHADGGVTQPGLLADRTGKGAPSDRLAMLLLTLQARTNGTVRLCSGRVDGRGRPAATLARLLGNRWTSAGAAGVLRRLTECDAICLVRARTRSSLHNRGGIVIPDVKTQWRAARATAGANAGPGTPVQRRHSPTSSLATACPSRRRRADADNAAAGHLHASHTQVVQEGGDDDVVDGFSGEAEIRVPIVAGGPRVRARNHLPTAGTPSGRVDAADQVPAPPDPDAAPSHRRQRAPRLLLSETVHRVLREVPVLLARMNPWEQREAARAAGNAVRDADGDVDRVVRRLRFRYATTERIASPYGWLTDYGLVRRSDCGQPACESGIDRSTGARCVPCSYLAEGQRGRNNGTPPAQPSRPTPPPAGGNPVMEPGPAPQRPAPRCGTCPRCSTAAELGTDGLCGDCDLAQVISSVQQHLIEDSAQPGEQLPTSFTRTDQVMEVATRARDEAQRAGLLPPGVRASVRLAVQTYLLDRTLGLSMCTRVGVQRPGMRRSGTAAEAPSWPHRHTEDFHGPSRHL
ncbi:hypothetical protein ABTY61_32385 [Kitasatospora sp. NPDC096128]|uniref:hypothetical protein n=1 Tax=Kitasatospora sp. NPDC096128 TaxID=3155547 RepID=UPI00332336F3